MSSTSRAAHRRWGVAFKKRVVAEASRPGVSAAQIARRYDLNANLLFNWKKKYGTDVALVPVEIVPDNDHGLPESSSHRLNDYGTPSVEHNADFFLS